MGSAGGLWPGERAKRLKMRHLQKGSTMSLSQSYLIEDSSTQTPRDVGYFVTSGVLHTAFFFAVIFMGVNVPVIKAPPVVEIEFMGTNAPLAPPVPVSRLSPPKHHAPEVQSPKLKDDSVVKVLPIKAPTKSQAQEEKKVTAVKIAKPVQAKRAAPAPKKVVVAPRVGTGHKATRSGKARAAPVITHTESPVEAPELSTEEFEKSIQSSELAATSELDTDSLNSDLDQMDRESEAEVAKAREKMRKETEALLAAQAAAAERVKAEQAQRDKALAAAHAQEAAKLAAPKTGNSAGMGIAEGSEIRSLADLRQMSGNIKPQYDIEDRIAGRQGQVVFHAYVNPDGSLSNFKMIKSTGHRTLDGKTLKALKTWRFYAGQQGWVELPFQWDLVGGAREIKGQLRAK